MPRSRWSCWIASKMTDPAVVIVGAGAAGIAAGLELQARKVPFVILEAQDRVGGRAYTDKASMPVAWDQGCHWLHCADKNPLVEWADKLGSDYHTKDYPDWFGVHLQGRWAESALRDEAMQQVFGALDAVTDAGRAGEDVPASQVIPGGGAFDALARHWFQLFASGDPEQVSAASYGDYEDTGVNWPVLSGYGDLFERMARDLPVRTGIAVRKVEQGARHVRVETAEGTVAAKACIITVSTGVLNGGGLSVSGGPAADLLDDIRQVPLGHYEKVALLFNQWPFEGFRQPSVTIDSGNGSAVNFQIFPFDGNLALAHVAGTPALELITAGGEALAEYVVDHLVAAFGSDIRRQLAKTVSTGWQLNPHVRGAYSYAQPGHAGRRRDMIAADTGNVAFAGEAFSLHGQTSAHGAYRSGRDVAARMVDSLMLA
jgi:monoamine oxidase